MNENFELETQPLTRALISAAVKSLDPIAAQDTAPAPMTHRDLLHLGITRVAQDISEGALLLLGRSTVSSNSGLSEDVPVVIGFSLFVMLGILQAVSSEGIGADAQTLTERLIKQQLHEKTRTTDTKQAASREILEISRIATQIPGQIVGTAQGDVEALFSRCYSVLPGFILGTDATRAEIMPIFGTALHVLLQSQVKPDC